jgi:CYTH domain-containing protein
MDKEIKRKFLLAEGGQDYSTPALSMLYPSLEIYPSVEDLEMDVFAHGNNIQQGYLPINSGIGLARMFEMSYDFEPAEARLRSKAGKFYFTLKGDGNLLRNRVQEEIPEKIFHSWWDLTTGQRVEKFRLDKPYQEYMLELDVYLDRDLTIAEVEFPSIEIAHSFIPLGRDVTEDPQYKNRNLAK